MGDIDQYFKKDKSVADLTGPSPAPVSRPVVTPPDNFPFAIAYLNPNEGGYADIPGDSGGPTNFGITQADLARWRGHTVSAKDVQEMSYSEALDIYRKWYWADCGLDKISDPAIATALFDQCVLNGPVRAISYAQLAANNSGSMLVADGVIGPKTLAAFASVGLPDFIRAFISILKGYYGEIVHAHPSKEIFYAGWIARAERLSTLIDQVGAN